MSVRRLAPPEVQPKEFSFTQENLDWAKKQIAKYPEGRQASAIIPLMWRAQEQNNGWLPEVAIRLVADMLGMDYIRSLEVATFYTQFQLQPVGSKAHVQVCGTTPCQLRGSDELFEVCKKRIHPEPLHVSADGKLSWEEVECLGACVNAPMALIWNDTYEDLNAENFEKLLDGFAAGKPPKPGPQIDRQFSEPAGGATSLTDAAIYSKKKSSAESGQNQTPLTDTDAKRPTAAASQREAPTPKPPLSEKSATAEPKPN